MCVFCGSLQLRPRRHPRFCCPLITRMSANKGKSFAQSASSLHSRYGEVGFGVRGVLDPWDKPEAEHRRARSQYPMGLASLFVLVLGSIQNDLRRRVAFPKLREIEQKFLFLFACIRVIRGQLFGCPNAFGALWSITL